MAHSTTEALKILPVPGLLLKAKHTFFPSDKHIDFVICGEQKLLAFYSMRLITCNDMGKGHL